MQTLRYVPARFLLAVLAFLALAEYAPAQSLTLKQTYVNPTPAGDAFGFSVAGLGNNVLIGAPLDNGGIGAVYLFDGTTGSLLQTFLNPSPAAGDQFGFFVAAVGSNVLVGAPFDDGSATDAGVAYLFDGATGALLQTFSNPAPALGDQFGFRVSGAGSNVLISAPFSDTGASDNGVVYLFDGVSGSLLQTFLNPTPEAGDQFGAALAGVGANVLIGAPFDNTGASDAGAAYLMDGATGSLLLTILNPTPAISDQFGSAVAASGGSLAIAAHLDNTGATDAGAAYLFDGTSGVLLQTFLNPTPANGDQFGSSISAIAGNIIVVGARQDDTGASNAGSAYSFDGNTGALLQTFNNPAPVIGDQFGFSIAGIGSSLLIGTPLNDTGATNSGAAYLYGPGNEPPLANAGVDQSLECSSPAGTPVTLDGSASSDPDLDALTYTWRENSIIIAGPTTSATSVVPLGLGIHTVELTVEDGNGADDTDEVTITIVDTAPPTITLNGDNPMTLECHIDSYTEPGAAVSDACDPAPVLVISGTVDANTLGAYVVTYTASDASGNSASTTRTVNVVDTTPPAITLNGDNPMSVECHAGSYSEPGATVSDACDPSPTLVISGTVDPNVVGTYSITYAASDASGNNSSATRTVNVVDTVPPVITLEPAVVLWETNKFKKFEICDMVANVTDGCAGSIALSEVTVASASSDELPHGYCWGGDDDDDDDDDDDPIIIIDDDCEWVKLLIDRSSSGNGRVYTVNLQVSDPSGNLATAAFKVSVRKYYYGMPIDDGPAYTVNSNCSGASSTRVTSHELEDAENIEMTTAALIPAAFALQQNYPNPFNPETQIAFDLPEASHVTLKIFNSLGEEIRTLAAGEYSAGRHELRWDGQSGNGARMPSGVYFYQMITPAFKESKRMLLAK